MLRPTFRNLVGLWLLVPALVLAAPPPFSGARTEHTATLLPTGEVLFAGGRNPAALATTSLYGVLTNATRTGASMPSARARHTATLLRSGRVLVVGGVGSAGTALATAVEYNPLLNRWSTVAPPSVAREGHTATLLADGRVLVLGGNGQAATSLASGEVYDPVTQTWSALPGPMTVARSAHTATLLGDGTVLVVGGHDASGALLGTAEVLSLSASPWSPVQSNPGGRDRHTATLLRSGDVLVAGGVDSTGSLATATIFSPASGTWSPTGSASVPRHSHRAVLLADGRVLVSGGTDAALVASLAIYDPAAGNWTDGSALATPRLGHTSTLLPNGRVVIAGGTDVSAQGLDTLEAWRALRPSIRSVGRIPAARSVAESVLLTDGRVLMTGGDDGNSPAIATTLLYSPQTETWSVGPPMNLDRIRHQMALLHDGTVLVATGETGGDSRQAEVFVPATNSWDLVGLLQQPRELGAMAVVPDGRVLAAGGSPGAGCSNTAEVYEPLSRAFTLLPGNIGAPICRHTITPLTVDLVLVRGDSGGALFDPTTSTFSPIAAVPYRRDHTANLLPDGSALNVGGNTVGAQTSTERYEAGAGVVASPAPITGHAIHATAVLPSGDVAVFGGYTGGSAQNIIEIYDAIEDSWISAGTLLAGRFNHTANALLSGEVVIAGGSGADRTLSELFDEGYGAASAPSITAPTIGWPGATLVIASTQLDDPSADLPLLVFQSLHDERRVVVPTSDWTATQFRAVIPPTLTKGYWAARAFIGGVPAAAVVIRILGGSGEPCTVDAQCAGGTCRVGICDPVAPLLSAVPGGQATCGQPFSYQPVVSGDGPLDFVWRRADGTVTPPELAFDPTTGSLDWTPPLTKPGVENLVLEVSGPGGVATAPLDIDVACPPSQMQIGCACSTGGGSASVAPLLVQGALLWLAVRRRKRSR